MGTLKESGGGNLEALASEARSYVWMGSIPLLINLHSSEVTSLPAPSPFLVLAPRNGYLPLLADTIKPHFQSALPPGSDTIWFDYEKLPLKWHIPTGVLFDLLCAEPERPWNLTVHFRAYPLELLSPCEGEETVKWNFINAMKEASYVMYGSTKSVMNLSQLDQVELWRSVVKGDLENFDLICTRLRPGSSSSSGRTMVRRSTSGEVETDTKTLSKLGSELLHGKIPIRLYIRQLKDVVDDPDDILHVSSWDDLVYLTRPIDFPREEGFAPTLRDALMKVVPQLFSSPQVVLLDETDSCASSDGSEVEVGHVVIPRSYSDVARGKVGDVETLSTPSNDGPEVSPGVETDDPTVLSQGLEEDVHMEPDDVSQEPCRSFRGDSQMATQKSSAGVWEGLHLDSTKIFNGFVRIQGIEPNLDIPLDWVARNLCGPEQFIHLCIYTWVAL